MFKRVVVGNDGSDNAVQAIEMAAEVAKANNAELIVAHVWHLPATAYIGAPYAPLDLSKQMDETKKSANDRAVEVLDRFGIAGKLVELEGNPADAIIGLADDEKADLIVVGSRGLGAVERFVLGSTSERIVRHAACPVLVVR